jgi:serine/threonine-protein kinase RsbW
MMEEAVSGRVELRIPRRGEFVRVARMATCALAAQLGFPYDLMKDVELAVAEACTNAVQHANAVSSDKQESEEHDGLRGGEACDEIVLRFSSDAHQLAVEVIDRGQGFDPAAVESMDREGQRPGGLGLMVIRQVMDEVTIVCDKQTGTCVRMVKHRAGEGS